MRETPKEEKPFIELSKINERDALCYAVGEYFETFSNLEQFLAMAVCNLLKIENALLHFLWRDSFTDQKIKTLRRAAVAILGPDNQRWLELKPSLNEISTTAVEFRNLLAHGLIIDEQGTTKHGKPGVSPHLLYQDFQPITTETVLLETARIRRLSRILIDFISGPPNPAE